MPTILFISGWRFFFYSNESNEPIHIHVEKGEKSCKYWLDTKNFGVSEAFTRGMNSKDKRQVIKIIIANFEYIEKEWTKYQRRKNHGH
jgi:hypothetical protein